MKKILLIVGIFTTMFVHAQNGRVGIGTSSPDASAALEVSSANKGFLAPRVALQSATDKVTIPNPATGLMVYNTNNGTNVDANYLYWWDGAKWVRPITDMQTVGTTPPQVISWIFSVAGEPGSVHLIQPNIIHTVGPFTVSSSGWYLMNFRMYFMTTFGTAPASDTEMPLAKVWFVVSQSASTTSMDEGQLFDSRFYISESQVNPNTSPFLYLQAGRQYYIKYRAETSLTPANKINIYVSKERRAVLQQFK